MVNLSLSTGPSLSTDVERNLAELAEHRMLAPARRGGHELTFVGVTGPPQHESIYRNEWGTWEFTDHLKDPTAKEYATLFRRHGGIPIPPDQLAWLRELDRCGVDPQLAWIVHQLPDDYRDGDPRPRLVPAPRELREMDEQLSRGLATATDIFFKSIAKILNTAANATATSISLAGDAARAGAAVGAALGAGYDPLVLGGVRHPELPAVAWCLLAQWEWE